MLGREVRIVMLDMKDGGEVGGADGGAGMRSEWKRKDISKGFHKKYRRW